MAQIRINVTTEDREILDILIIGSETQTEVQLSNRVRELLELDNFDVVSEFD